MLRQNSAEEKPATAIDRKYNGGGLHNTTSPYLEQQRISRQNMAQSNYMETNTTAQYMYENGHENKTGSDNQFNETNLVENMANDDSNMVLTDSPGTKRSSPAFETFVMTGDMIIRTTTPIGDSSKKTSVQKKRKPSSQGQYAGGDGDTNKNKLKEKGDGGSSGGGVPKKKVSKIPQPKSAGSTKEAKEKKKGHASRIPKPSSSSRENSPKSSPKNSPKKIQQQPQQSKLPQLQGSNIRSPVLSFRQHSASAKPSGVSSTTPSVSDMSQVPSSQSQAVEIEESFNNNSAVDEIQVSANANLASQYDQIFTGEDHTLSSHQLLPNTPPSSDGIGAAENSFSMLSKVTCASPYYQTGISHQQHVPVSSTPAYPELDIPPDDITSEDTAYQSLEDAFVNLEDLPPPPDDLLCDVTSDGSKQSGGVANDIDQAVPEIGGFIPVYSPSELNTGRRRFHLDSNMSSSNSPPPSVNTADSAHASPRHTSSTLPEQKVEVTAASQICDPSSVAYDVSASSQAVEEDPLSILELNTECDVDVHHPSRTIDPQDSLALHNPPPGAISQKQQPYSDKSPAAATTRIPVIKSSCPNSVSGVRNSKSHENYLESNNVDPSMACVDIDFEDDIALSVDVLHYQERVSAVCAERQSKSLDNSPERGGTGGSSNDRHTEKILMPTFINIEEPRSIGKLKEGGRLKDMAEIRQSVGEPKVGYHATPTSGIAGKLPREMMKEIEGFGANNNTHFVMLEKIGESYTDADDVIVEEESATLESSGVTGVCLSEELRVSIDELKNIASPVSDHQNCEQTGMARNDPSLQNQTDTEQIGASNGRRASDDSSHDHDHMSRDLHHSSPTHNESYAEDDSVQTLQESSTTEELSPGGAGVDASSPPESFYDSDSESIYHQPIKDVDRPSAERLAKRLYSLDGFKKQDISRHLGKKNEFSQLVGEEYLKYFDLSEMTLDVALREFLRHLTLAGETQERERVLAHFSHRYVQCNPEAFNSDDACHTLTCALMLLNTDHHGQNIGRKMTLAEFIENLAELNDGENFPKEILKHLFHSIKDDKLECEFSPDVDELALAAGAGGDPAVFIGANPFLEVPDPNKAVEYRKGYVMRKCCIDPDGRKTPIGKRGWKMFYAVLRDMVLYLHKGEHSTKKPTVFNNVNNAIRIHHALATKATDYTKKCHVFRLQTSDWAQYLFQTSNVKECQEWMDTINLVAASLSAPPLPGAVGSQRKFQRQLMPSSYTRLNLSEQLQHHEQRVATLEKDLHEHRLYPPEKGSKSRIIQDYTDKESYLQFELKRFKTYSFLLQSKMAAFPELEPSLVEIAIGEVEEPPSPPSPEAEVIPKAKSSKQKNTESSSSKTKSKKPAAEEASKEKSKPMTRNKTDRYSYRAAIYNQDGS